MRPKEKDHCHFSGTFHNCQKSTLLFSAALVYIGMRSEDGVCKGAEDGYKPPALQAAHKAVSGVAHLQVIEG
jgi:hypothetical protein